MLTDICTEKWFLIHGNQHHLRGAEFGNGPGIGARKARDGEILSRALGRCLEVGGWLAVRVVVRVVLGGWLIPVVLEICGAKGLAWQLL